MNQYSHEYSAEKYDTWLHRLIKCNLNKISACDIITALEICMVHFDTTVENLNGRSLGTESGQQVYTYMSL